MHHFLLAPRRGTLYLFAPILLAALSISPGLSAQEADADDEDTSTVEETIDVTDSLPFLPTSNTVASKLPTELTWTPANIGAVSGTLFEQQGADVLGDALANVSGVNVQTGSGVFDYFVLRGFDSLTSGLILTDGAIEPETTFYQLYDVERVEVFKGPAGFLYGSNPLAGVVNLVRKRPVPHRFANFAVEGGSFGSREASIDFNHGSDEGATRFRLNGLWRESDGYRDGRDREVVAIHPTLSWRPDDRQQLTFSFESLDSDYRPDAGLPLLDNQLPDVPRERSYASPFDLSTQQVTRGQVDYDRQLDERWSLRDKLYYRELDWQTRGTLINGVLDLGFGDPFVFRTLFDLDDRQTFVGNQFEVLFASERHQLMAGVEIGDYADDYTLDASFLDPIGLFMPIENPGGVPIPIPGQAMSGDTETRVIAPYVVDQIQLSDRARLTVGARFDSIEFEDTVSGTSRSDGELSPLLGLVVATGDESSIYANAARSFSPASPRVIGDREPEEGTQFELGFRHHFAGGRVRTVVAAYQLERENIAIPDDNGFTQQAGDQRSQGIEAEFGGDFGCGINGTFSYAYTDAELTRFSEAIFLPEPPFVLVLDRSGNRPAFSPEHMFSGWLSRRFAGNWTVAGGVRWLDDQFIAEDNAAVIDSHTVVDAMVAYDFDRWRIALDLDNLTDETYETRGFGSFSVIPAEPFSASVRVELRR